MSEWISVQVKMPARCQPVLVVYENTCRDDLMVIAWHDVGCWWLNHKLALSRIYDHVTHWMPLPELPPQ